MKKIIFNKQQDFISIIAPASGCPDAQARLAKSIEMLNLQGFKTLVDDNPIEGKILGGNLTVFSKLIGTSINLKTNNILLLEDINEKGYAIHRNLVQLKNAGIFDGIEAVIFGDFTIGYENIELAIKSFCLNHIPK